MCKLVAAASVATAIEKTTASARTIHSSASPVEHEPHSQGTEQQDINKGQKYREEGVIRLDVGPVERSGQHRHDQD